MLVDLISILNENRRVDFNLKKKTGFFKTFAAMHDKKRKPGWGAMGFLILVALCFQRSKCNPCNQLSAILCHSFGFGVI